jgi:hypothetical protein
MSFFMSITMASFYQFRVHTKVGNPNVKAAAMEVLSIHAVRLTAYAT